MTMKTGLTGLTQFYRMKIGTTFVCPLFYAGGWPIFALHHSHGGCPILAFFARACRELVEGVGGDAAGALLSVLHRPLCKSSYPPFACAKDGVPAAVMSNTHDGRSGRSHSQVSQSSEAWGTRHDNHQDSNFLFRLR